MTAKGFSTEQIRCFIATRDALGAALPTWRAPLALPEDSLPIDPFTGEPTRDPDPSADAIQPDMLPFENIPLPGLEDWEQHYLALDLALNNEPNLAREAWDEDMGTWSALMARRGLMESPFFGGAPDECGWILVVPSRLVRRLSSLDDGDVAMVTHRWKTFAPRGAKSPPLRKLRALAQRALQTEQEMFLWLIHPMYRAEEE